MQLKLVYSLIILLLFSAFTPTQQNPTVFMIGDSTMADRNTNNENQERGWGQMLPCFLTDGIKVENHAACGRSTLSFIREGRWQTVLNKLKQGDYVIIQF